MILYPKLYLNSVKEITIDLLNKHNLKGIILDVDNTLIDYHKNIPDGIEAWAENLKQAENDIGESAIDNISAAIRALEKIETLDENYTKASCDLKNIYY